MKKKQKRYESEHDVEAEVNSTKRKQIALTIEAESLNRQALERFKKADSAEAKKAGQSQWLRESGLENKREAHKKGKAALRLDTKLKHLKDTWAAFNTVPAPGILPDSSIVLQ